MHNLYLLNMGNKQLNPQPKKNQQPQNGKTAAVQSQPRKVTFQQSEDSISDDYEDQSGQEDHDVEIGEVNKKNKEGQIPINKDNTKGQTKKTQPIKQQLTQTNKAVAESLFKLAEQNNDFKGFHSELKAQKSFTNIKKHQLTVTQLASQKKYGLDSQVLKVDFKVIVARMNPQLKQTFETLGKSIYQDYLKRSRAQKQWNLHGNGFFINYQEGYRLCIITQDKVYKGVVFTTPSNNIIPDKQGTLITKDGIYDGSFRRGLAHGQGKFKASVHNLELKQATFSGTWKDGLLAHGKIQDKHFLFKGKLADGKANDLGFVKIKQSKTIYEGCFKNGLYHTIDARAKLKTKNYQYLGQFQQGKKEKSGILKEFQRKGKRLPKNMKYRPADTYDGEWIDDHYVTKRKIREERKLQAEEGYEQVGKFYQNMGESATETRRTLKSTIKGQNLSQSRTKIYFDHTESQSNGGSSLKNPPVFQSKVPQKSRVEQTKPYRQQSQVDIREVSGQSSEYSSQI